MNGSLCVEMLHSSDLSSSMESLAYDSSSTTSPNSINPGTRTHPQQRTKRMRTSFKHHQLRTMKSYFNVNQNPDAKDLKQLAQKTGLSKRVLQVSSVSTTQLLSTNPLNWEKLLLEFEEIRSRFSEFLEKRMWAAESFLFSRFGSKTLERNGEGIWWGKIYKRIPTASRYCLQEACPAMRKSRPLAWFPTPALSTWTNSDAPGSTRTAVNL